MFAIPVMPGVADWINTVFAGFDQSVTLLIHKLYELGGDVMTAIMSFISLLGMKGAFLIALSLVLLFFKKTRRFGTAMSIGLFLGAVLVNLYLKDAIARPRPYTLDFYKALWEQVGQHVESDFCFPSGHTNAAFAAMVPVFMLGKKKWRRGDPAHHDGRRRGGRHDHRHPRRYDRHHYRHFAPARVVSLGSVEKER